MYFSLIKLRQNISPKEIVELNKGGYQIHQLIWNLFSDHPDRRRDFMYRHESAGRWPTFYTISEREPIDVANIWDIRTKAYNPQIRAGQKLGFTLRANPVRTHHNENGRQQRHDVIMEEKLRLKNDGNEFDLPEVAQEQGFEWLAKRAGKHGFSISQGDTRIDGYRQQKLFKGKGKHPMTFSTLDFNGILTVTKPDNFIENALFRGIGPAKAFGCGLMLVRQI